MKTEKKNPEEERDYDLTALGDSAGLLEGQGPSEQSEASETSEASEESESSEESEEAEASEASEASESSEESEESEASEESEENFEAKLPKTVKLVKLAADLLTGAVSEEELERFLDAAAAREEIAAAKEEVEAAYQRGLIEGRNEQIEERLEMPAIGAPDLCGAPPIRQRGGNSIFDLAKEAR